MLLLSKNFILGNKVPPKKAHSMTQVPMTLTFGSRSKFPQLGKVLNNWPYLGFYFTLQTSYLLPTYNPMRCILWPKVKVKSINNEQKVKQFAISRILFHLQTSYLVSTYNPLRHIQWPNCRWPWLEGQRSRSNFPKNGKN